MRCNAEHRIAVVRCLSVTSVTYIDYAVSVVQLFKLLSSIIHYDV